MIWCNISVVWKICTNLSDNRFSCGLTQHCLGERRLEIWVISRAGWALKIPVCTASSVGFPERSFILGSWFELWTRLLCFRLQGLVGWLENEHTTQYQGMHVDCLCPKRWLPGCPRWLGSAAVAMGTPQRFFITSWLWALVIHFTWQLTRALGVRTHFTFAGWGKTFDCLISELRGVPCSGVCRPAADRSARHVCMIPGPWPQRLEEGSACSIQPPFCADVCSHVRKCILWSFFHVVFPWAFH